MAVRPPPTRRRRLAAAILPPVAALIAAYAYTAWQADRAEREVAAFCAGIAPGLAIRDFAELALARDLEVSDEGPDSRVLTAAKGVYTWRRQIYACHAAHEGGRVLRTRVEHRSE